MIQAGKTREPRAPSAADGGRGAAWAGLRSHELRLRPTRPASRSAQIVTLLSTPVRRLSAATGAILVPRSSPPEALTGFKTAPSLSS